MVRALFLFAMLLLSVGAVVHADSSAQGAPSGTTAAADDDDGTAVRHATKSSNDDANGEPDQAGLRTLADFEALSARNRIEFAQRTVEYRSESLTVEQLPEASLILFGVERLSEQEAQRLAAFAGKVLLLPDLATLDAESAAALAAWRPDDVFRGHSHLMLTGLTSLDFVAAAHLVRWGRDAYDSRSLYLGMRTLDAMTAQQLSHWSRGTGSYRRLVLGRVETLEVETLRNLILWAQGDWGVRELSLNGLTELTPDDETAEYLARWSHHDFGRLSVDIELARVIHQW